MVYNLARISLKSFSTRLKDLAFLGALIIISLLANCGLVNLAAIVSPFKPLLGKNLIYAIPIGLGPIYAALFLGMETGLAMTFLVATLYGAPPAQAFPPVSFPRHRRSHGGVGGAVLSEAPLPDQHRPGRLRG